MRTGRARSITDTSQTLAISTADSVQRGDGQSTKIRKGTKSAHTAPHKHQENLIKERSEVRVSRREFADAGNGASGPSEDALEDKAEENARHEAINLAMAGLRHLVCCHAQLIIRFPLSLE